MSNMHPKFITKITPAFSEGALLAIDLLEEIGTAQAMAQCSFDPQWRKGQPQRDVFGEYLAHLADDPEVRRGFSVMLSTAISMEMEGRGPKAVPAYLEMLATMPSDVANKEWDRLRAEERSSDD